MYVFKNTAGEKLNRKYVKKEKFFELKEPTKKLPSQSCFKLPRFISVYLINFPREN